MVTKAICKAFDITEEKAQEYNIPDLPQLPEDFGILLIVGSSGGGKTSMLKKYFNFDKIAPYQWDNQNICDHFETANDAIDRLGAVGLNSIPAWLKPFHILSNGEQFRANLAMQLQNNAVIDEFTSVVDRNVAKSTCVSVRKYIDKTNLKNIVFASCHRDIIEWLEPDFVYDVDTKELLSRGSLRQRPKIKIEIRELPKEEKEKAWEVFRKHHYLNEKLNKAAKCYVAYWNNVLVGFSSSLAMPSGSLKNAWREHRTVILPDFQGMGIGTKLSNKIAELHLKEGKRYFSRTTHFRFGEYREKSPLWRPTSKNKVLRKDILNSTRDLYNNYQADGRRVCYSHEYIGKKKK